MKTTGLNIGIMGLGVVGAATAHRLHDLGNKVYATDLRAPENIQDWSDNFHFLKQYTLDNIDATFMALPTPSTEEGLYSCLMPEQRIEVSEGRFNESLDTKVYRMLAQPLGEQLKNHDDYHLFIVRSTVEPGLTRSFGQQLEEISGKELGKDFGLGMIPEFLRAYNSVQDEMNASLIVTGVLDEKSQALIEQVYQNLPPNEHGQSRLYPVGLEEAELIKLESNAINAIWISLNNSRLENYDMIREKTGMSIDYDKMTHILKNVTETFRNPNYGTSAGLFYGGTCLKKDPGALHSWLEDKNQIFSHFARYVELSMHVNLHLQKRILNDHIFPRTLRNGIPERLKGRDHETYDNIRKTEYAMEKGGTFD